MTTYKAMILIDRDGMETCDERRTLTEGRSVFEQYKANADEKLFSLKLIDLVTDRVVTYWENEL